MHLFRRDGLAGSGSWEYEQLLLPRSLQHTLGFGKAIALVGNDLWIGAPFEDLRGWHDAGVVYRYRYEPAEGRWNLVGRRLPPPSADACFGTRIEVQGDRMVVSAAFDGCCDNVHWKQTWILDLP